MSLTQTERSIAKELREECNAYDQTVQALKALAIELRYDDSKKSLRRDAWAGFGRRFDTTPLNRVSPVNTVTPDLAVLLQPDHGVIAEAKIALSRNAELRRDRLVEVQKYDDDLRGWPNTTGRVLNHDVVLVVHLTRAYDVGEQLAQMQERGEVRFDRKFGVIGYALIEQAQMWLTLELKHGELWDADKTKKLRRMVPISLEHLAGEPRLALMRLYDHRPPMPYLLNLIHEAMIGNLSQAELDDLRDVGEVRKPFTVDQLTSLLANNYGPGQDSERSPEIPRRAWIVEAVDRLVALDWVEAANVAPDSWIYIVKRRRKPMEKFISYCAAERAKQIARVRALEIEMAQAPLLFDKAVMGDGGSTRAGGA